MPSPRPPTRGRGRPLTERERRFVEAYFTEPSAVKAAIAAGYSAKVAGTTVTKLLKREAVLSAIERRQKVLASRNIATAERVIEEHAKIAFAKITDAVGWDAVSVTAKPSEELSDDIAAAISEVELVDDGKTARVRVKMHAKQASLDALGRHFGIYNDKLRIEGDLLDQVRALMDSPDDDDAV